MTAKENTSATFVLGKRSKILFAAASEKRDKNKPVPVEINLDTTPYTRWGDDNSHPNDILKSISDNPIIHPNFHFRSCHIYSGQLRYGVVNGYEKVGPGNYVKDFEPIIDPKIEEWKADNNIGAYYQEIIKDLLYWWSGAALLTLNDAGTYITNLSVVDWMHCRYSKQNENGEITHIYRDPNFPFGTEKTWKVYPLIDRYFNGLRKLKASSGSEKEYIYPLTIYSNGKIYYQDPAWQTILNTSWPAVSRKVAQFKEYFLAQQMGAMYVVHIPYGFWTWKYPDWEEKIDLQAERRETTINDLDEKITGVKQTGKTLALTFKPGTETEESTKFIIEPLSGNKLFDGVHLEDSQEAAANTFTALAFNQEIIGSRPGKKSGGGSGSNITAAANTETIANQLFRDYALEVLNFISRFNGWKDSKGRQIEWQAESILNTTLNTGGNTRVTTDPTTTVTKQQ
jgi:hypothetical protein